MFIDNDFLSGSYFEVVLTGLGVLLQGKFTAVSGLNMEVEYEVYNEGGANYPRYFFKQNKPQVLVLEQGVVTTLDSASVMMALVSSGISISLSGEIILMDSFGAAQRTWTIVDAHIQKYVGPDLNSNQPALAVNRIELIHNGCY